MSVSRRGFLSLAASLPAFAQAPPSAEIFETDLFRAGEGPYHTYRIPALIETPRGNLLAFCEGRRAGRSDSGDIDLLLRRSSDGGRTWSPAETVWDGGSDTIGNPCPVVDRRTGTIWLLLTRNAGDITEDEIMKPGARSTRTVWVMSSTSEGATWSDPREITATAKDPAWSWYATGPGNGIQLRSGRMIIPCDHARFDDQSRHSHVIYSDDGGKTWLVGGVAGKDTNESAIIERADGSLLLNMRSYQGRNRRALAESRDRGATWSAVTLDDGLIEPVCQASLIGDSQQRLLFSNPASTKRERILVRLSYDEGRTWPVCRPLHGGPGAYTSLAALRGGRYGCLYERGTAGPYEAITFASFSLEWLAGRRKPELVEVAKLDPSVRLDVRYATASNLAGRAVYSQARVFQQRIGAEAMLRAHRGLAAHGYGLLLFDGYRPWAVTSLFWDVTPPDKHEFVANPARGSKHNRGCAIDLSMFHLATGKEVRMPSVYDEMSERAYPTYSGGPAEARTARDLLRRAMEAEGYAVEPNEWWHFNYKDWQEYPLLDLPFEKL